MALVSSAGEYLAGHLLVRLEQCGGGVGFREQAVAMSVGCWRREEAEGCVPTDVFDLSAVVCAL